jgi:hypothetical protein
VAISRYSRRDAPIADMRATTYPIRTTTAYQLAIVARPRGGDWLCDELTALSREGIEILVSMLTPEEAQELGLDRESIACEDAAITFVNVPIPDRSVPNDKQHFLSKVDLIAEWIRQGRSVGVHCRACICRCSCGSAGTRTKLLSSLSLRADAQFPIRLSNAGG